MASDRFDPKSVSDIVRRIFGASITEAIPARLGNPVNGNVIVPDTISDQRGMVYIHDPAGGDLGSGMAHNTLLDVKELAFGAPVRVKWDGRQFRIIERNDEFWSEFWEDVFRHDQEFVTIDQIVWATLHPTSPTPSMFAVVAGAVYSMSGTLSFADAQQTQDFTSLIPTTTGKAKAYLVEITPSTGALTYTAGAEFNAELTHEQALAASLYPTSVAATRMGLGWIKLVKGMTAIRAGANIFNAPELLSKGVAGQNGLSSGGTGSDLSATGPGFLHQASNGAVVTVLKHNLAATTAPTANEDSGDGYAVGSLWIDTTNDKFYKCVDATAAAAVWIEGGGGGGGSTAVGVDVYEDTGETITSASTQALVFANERTDTNGFHDNVTNNTRLTVPSGKGGKYYIFAHFNAAPVTPAAETVSYYLRINGTTTISIEQAIPIDHSDAVGSVGVFYNLSATDYVELIIDTNAASFSVDSFAEFGMYLIGT